MRTMLALAVLAVPLAFVGPAALAAPGDDNHPDSPGPWRYVPPAVQGQPAHAGAIAGPAQSAAASRLIYEGGEGHSR